MYSAADDPKGPGFPIRKSTDQRVLAPPRGLSQRATSFIASVRQGIHQMPLKRLIQRNPVTSRDKSPDHCPKGNGRHSRFRQERAEQRPAIRQNGRMRTPAARTTRHIQDATLNSDFDVRTVPRPNPKRARPRNSRT